MAHSSRAATILSSPSFNDSEAASQQLLAEASSPVRRPAAAPNSSAVIGANLLNHARTLTKPASMAPLVPNEKAGKLPKLGHLKPAQLKPGQLKAIPLPRPGRPGKPGKPGKLARASLSSFVSEGLVRKVRGDRTYDIDPSPQKRRPHSLPSQVAASEDEDFQQGLFAQEGDVMVPEASRAQPEGDILADSPRDPDAPVVQEAPAMLAPTEPPAVSPKARQDPSAAPKKQRGRPRKSGDSTAPAPSPEPSTAAAPGHAHPQEGTKADHIPSSPPQMLIQEEIPKKQRGRPRKSDQSTTLTRRPDVGQPLREVPKEPIVLSQKLKRKVRAEGDPENEMHGFSSREQQPAKKLKQLNGPAMISPDAVAFDEHSIAPRATAQRDLMSHSDEDLESSIPIRSSRSRTARAEAEVSNAQEHSATAIITAAAGPKAKPTMSLARTRSTKFSSTSNPSASTRGFKRRPVAQETCLDEVDETTAASQREQQSGDQGDAEMNLDATDEGRNVERGDEDAVQRSDGQPGRGDNEQAVAGIEHDVEQRDRPEDVNNQDTNPTKVDQEKAGNSNQSTKLDKLFRFTDPEQRSGNCATKLGRAIRRLCDRSRVVLSRPGDDCTVDDIAKCKSNLVDLLRSVGVKIQDERRPIFKRDAFAYLFRDLTLVLEAMHNKLQEKQGDITESLESMLIVHSYIRELLRFKDTMDSWKVVVPQLTKGDRLIKGVETALIAPLRVLEKEFAKHLRRLQKAEESQRAVAEAQRKRDGEEQDAIRQEEMLRSIRERRRRWQDLHIIRMQCEPDPSRRRRLRFVEPVQATETDANGRPFERIPFFGERSAPPPQWTAASSGREWTDEQETALLDALQSSANLERIFKTYCRPGGILRDFSVSDIAAKMAWVRSGWAQLSHQHGWEVPEWVKNIPVLP